MKTRLAWTIPIVLAVILAVMGAGCEALEGDTYTPPGIGFIVMAKAVDAEKKPINPTTTFTTDVSEVFCSARMNNAPSPVKVTGKWIYVNGELKDVSNYEIDSASVEVKTGYFSMSLSRPTNGWPKGNYKLVYIIDGKEVGSASFKIQ